jgi:hypothetical protein
MLGTKEIFEDMTMLVFRSCAISSLERLLGGTPALLFYRNTILNAPFSLPNQFPRQRNHCRSLNSGSYMSLPPLIKTRYWHLRLIHTIGDILEFI